MDALGLDAFPFGAGVVFLDGRAALARAPFSHLAIDPLRELRIMADHRDDPLTAIERFLEQESSRGRTVIGALGYELGRWIEPRTGGPPTMPLPLVALLSYERTYTFDHRQGRWHPHRPPVAPSSPRRTVWVSCPRPTVDFRTYAEKFARVREGLVAGEIYQANLSIPFEATIEGDPAVLYERLATRSPAPFGAYLDFGDFQILSNSPELFLARRGDRLATRPIKGTRPRGRSRAEDEMLAAELARDPKERAEHVMIVDLERNDLGRIARVGSVVVEEFAAVESYATLHHLESTVTARARSGVRLTDCLRAMFPGGSITGAPKIRAMQLLDELEPEGRGFYTGGILHYPSDGSFTMSICIRTAIVDGGRIRFPAGGGLVVDSRPDAEYRECWLKARAFLSAASGDAA